MKILAIEPYYGGSHKVFLDGWSKQSRHRWTILKLPAYKWKWRMRHSAVFFAEQLRQNANSTSRADLLFCSDMLNLAEFKGLAPKEIADLPTIAYFHENQLTYPVRFESERDYQFAMTNLTTALAADAVWFNSAFHRDCFLEALEGFLKKMPDNQPLDAVEKIRQKANIHPPGIDDFKPLRQRKAGPVRILWAARWEHDKRPQDFFEALKILKAAGVEFRISVIGQKFRDAPDVFESARKEFAGHIDRWGYQKNRSEYENALAEADLIVSTTEHEFFGISVVEAIAAGCYPVLPKQLSYPEILGLNQDDNRENFFYDSSIKTLAERLAALARRIEEEKFRNEQRKATELMQRFKWKNLTAILDAAAENALKLGNTKDLQ